MKKQKQTRAKIIQSATFLINIKGFRATSVNEIIDKVGVTKGCFYHHFVDKEQLGLAVIEYAMDGFFSFLRENLSGKTAIKSLNNFFNAALKMHTECDFVGGCIFGNIALEMADEKSRIADAVKQAFTLWSKKLKLVVSEAQHNCELRRDLTASEITEMIIAILEGGIMLSRLNKKNPPLPTLINTLKKLIYIDKKAVTK